MWYKLLDSSIIVYLNLKGHKIIKIQSFQYKEYVSKSAYSLISINRL
jgi:hypothetical protein